MSDTKTELRMDAYYYGFEPTGVAVIDKVLSAVACAGKAYHHTADWQDETAHPSHSGGAPVAWIANAATEAAARIAELEEALRLSLPALEWCQKQWAGSPQSGEGINVLDVVRAALAKAEAKP